MQLRADSREYLFVPLTSPDDLSQDTLQISVRPTGATPVWRPAETVPGGVRCMVGQGTAVPLTPGMYHTVLVRVTDSTEQPVKHSGSVFVA